MTEDEKFVRRALAVLDSRVFVALAYAVHMAGGTRPSIEQVCETAKLFDVYAPELASFFGFALPLGKSIRTDRPHGYVDLLQPGAVARGPQSWQAWLGHACFLADNPRARVGAFRVH
jgi:hypothetical protein